MVSRGACQVRDIREMSEESIPSSKCQGIVMSKKYQANLNVFTDIQEWCNTLKYQCLPSCLYLFCEIYMVERSKEYQIKDECNGCPTCQKGVFLCSRERE